ncbi:MAG: hypothetical protein A3H57_02285 [Candidatus Taylorbacteria bacterium RIFCSPLOWO2_02_FULL_43_11]|uniref:Serine protease n=1 Tax=Candidatus Taylorbacteria bacterium RIFCSPHIGHO2_02_FULL_43_32b TaxID=1802306 RepID=A0A1G2MKR7_9BACT|nr:MAG: hypothetical protein A2743_02005 [Candidatus Taylorbacteria bacterium RIFCSPHIGHO2_01_FULL_43_47]OHA24324.1 MAG: hypothetical protein A3C72_03430 [Candidatus Taylorbacteria bacterium RIFCSPHIGHO2_02_FULL_43_32b]OHA31367.1 MAG: hypothetical protein A3B08_00360 [Candidatus Taylorbacteria bacterium RIFCSPLOWO2_01_FULL_43_44]OHA37733.1 MAG: hypothetical protein A3H57_02285 [Candidatus Taylorbacteria bacterium RIFCSPLOWO2_02_FULL_43_11]
MESLTKQQIVLLTLLVSFVTSIATGIVTVSLMDQAPQSVTQTINRVVERTVERVVPASVNVVNPSKESVVTKETVVVRDDDMIISAVEKNRNLIYRVIKIRNEFGEVQEKYGGLAVPVTADGILIADILALQKKFDDFGMIIPESYKAVDSLGGTVSIVPIGADEANGLVYFGAMTEDGKRDPNAFKNLFVSMGDSDKLKLGQSVVSLSGYSDNIVSTGIVSALPENKSATVPGKYTLVRTDVKLEGATPGTLLINLSGEIVGILSSKSADGSVYLPSKFMTEGLKTVNTVNNVKTSI